MNFSEKKEKNKITITVTLSDWRDPKDRVKYGLAQVDTILREKYDLKGYDLSPGAPGHISNIDRRGSGVFVYEKSVSKPKPAIKATKATKTIKTKKTTKSEG